MKNASLGKLIAFYVAGQSTVPLSVYKDNKKNIFSSYIKATTEIAKANNLSVDPDTISQHIESFYADLLADSVIAFPQLIKVIHSANPDELTVLKKLADTFTSDAPLKNEFSPFNDLLISELKGE